MMVVIESDTWLLVCVKYTIWSMWLVVSGTIHFLAVCKQRPTRNVCCGRETAWRRDMTGFMCYLPHPYSTLILGVFPLHQIAHAGRQPEQRT